MLHIYPMVLGGTVRTYSTSAKIVRIGVIKLSILSLEEDYDKHKQLHSHFTPVFFLYRSIQGLSMSNISPPTGVYMTEKVWSLSLDIKAADRGLDL